MEKMTPILDLLLSVPVDAHHIYKHDSMSASNYAYGLLCKRAANEIKRLQAELAAMGCQTPVAWYDPDSGLPYAWTEDPPFSNAVLLYALPTPPPRVPERLTPDGMYGAMHHYAAGWNDCIDIMTAPKPGGSNGIA